MSVLIGLAGAAFFVSPRPALQFTGALLFLLHSILDGCDGELARLKFQESRFGGVLDFWGDNVVHSAVFASMLGAMGSILGVVVGVALPVLAGLLVRGRGVDVRISALSAVLAFLFSCAVTVLFGVVPASRAAKMNPTEALRYE